MNIFSVGSNFKLIINAELNFFMDKMLICIYENYGSVCIKFAHKFCRAHDTFDVHESFQHYSYLSITHIIKWVWSWDVLYFCMLLISYMYMLSECELIDTENISLLSQNMKFVGEWAKRTNHKLHILSSRLIFFSINHIHIQMTCLSSLNQS